LAAPTFELVEAKLRPPQNRGGSVPRGQLISAVEGSREVPLLVLCAGPGWGKTTLLAQWASRSERPFAWVAVDEQDNDPIVLLTYIAAALDRVSPLDPAVFDVLASRGVSVEATAAPRVGAALATMRQQVVLSLDDLHLLDNPACCDAIASLGRHVPEGSQMVLSARSEPALPLAAWRARGLSLELGPDDLRMDEADARRLLSAAGVELPGEQIAQLTEHTEGWPAGLYLAALSVGARRHKDNGALTFSGSDRLVSSYLWSELLTGLPPDDFRFLTRTAVLARMSGPLCDAVLEEEGCATTLESQARSNLFLVPLDTDGGWYRYHHLFRELLHSELIQAEPDLVPQLLARAIEWCESNGHDEMAIDYAQQAGDVASAARLIERRALPVNQSGRGATVERWLHWLEEHEALEQNAAVAALGALLAAVAGRPAESERWTQAAERARYDGTLPDGSPSIDSWLLLLRALRCGRGAATMGTDAELALRTLARASTFWPIALLLLGISRWLTGEVEHAEDMLADAAEEGVKLGAPQAAALALSMRAAISIDREAWGEAEELVDQSALVIRLSRMDEYPTSAFAYAVAARVALHRGDAERAQALLVRAQRLRPRVTYALPYLAVQTRLELARAYLTSADAGGAETVLHEIGALLRRQPDLGTLPLQVEELRESLRTLRAEAPGASTLTEAELRLLPQLATHLSFREIGERMYLSRHTVKSHAMAIYRKLNVSSRSSAVERAGQLGLL
jgi:LuxR family maltose regulon positive regulatory protein